MLVRPVRGHIARRNVLILHNAVCFEGMPETMRSRAKMCPLIFRELITYLNSDAVLTQARVSVCAKHQTECYVGHSGLF